MDSGVMSFIDVDTTINCHLRNGDDNDTNHLNTSNAIDNSPMSTVTPERPSPVPVPSRGRLGDSAPRHFPWTLGFGSDEGLEDVSAPASPNNTFNFTAFAEQYKFDDSFLRNPDMSESEEEAESRVRRDDNEMEKAISEAKQRIDKKDEQVQLLMSELGAVTSGKEARDEECFELKDKVAELEETIQNFDQSQFGPAEISSYLQLPTGFRSGDHRHFTNDRPRFLPSDSKQVQTSLLTFPITVSSEVQTVSPEFLTRFTSTSDLLPETVDQSVQMSPFQIETSTQVVSIPSPDASIQVQPPDKIVTDASTQHKLNRRDTQVQAALPDASMIARCTSLRTTAASIKEELATIKDSVKLKPGFNLEKVIPKVLKSLAAVEKNATEELGRLKKSHAEALTKEREEKEEMAKKIETATKEKNEEILELKIRVAQLEYSASASKKASESKLISFSSRMSPEGSELDVDNISSLTDNTTSNGHTNGKVIVATLPEQSIPDGDDDSKSEHYEITRTKKEYLWLTPSADVMHSDDQNQQIFVSASANVVTASTEIEDLKLQLIDLEKKYNANLRYLNEQTAEREVERDEFHRESKEFERKLQELQRERDRHQDLSNQQKFELAQMEQRLADERTRFDSELAQRTDKQDVDLKNSIEKIYELRGIIRDLEDQVDLSTGNVGELRETNQFLRDELEKLLCQKVEDSLLKDSGDTLFVTANAQFAQDEILVQVQELTERLTKKLADLENYKWSASISRPGSGGSNDSRSETMSVCSEDVSVRDIVQAATALSKDHELTEELFHAIHRLDVHFENFVKFEEIMMKKLKDTEIRLGRTTKRQTELELEKCTCQQQLNEQLLRVSDLESLLDQRRFEPYPNALTLNELRARIKTLSEDLEEVKGQKHLKEIELDDLKEKMAASSALRANHATSAATLKPTHSSSTTTSPPPLRLSMTTQTMGPISRDRTVQTSPPPKLVNASVQAVLLPQHHGRDWEFSITGAPTPPYHSTPTDPAPTTKNSKLGNQRSPLFQSLFATADGRPETMRREPVSVEDRSPDLERKRMADSLGKSGNGDEGVPSAIPTFDRSLNRTPENLGERTLLQDIKKLRNAKEPLPRAPPPSFYESQTPLSRGIPRSNTGTGVPVNPPATWPTLAKPTKIENKLALRVDELEKEKKELQRILHLGQAELVKVNKALVEERRKYTAAKAGLVKLGEALQEREAKIKGLEELAALRAFQLEKLDIQAGVGRRCAEKELERVKGQLQAEIQQRYGLQEAFDAAKVHLQRHLATDQSMREENLKLMAELETLRELRRAQAAEIDAMAQKRGTTNDQGLNRAHSMSMSGGMPNQNQGNLELYLRAKSYRKALTWQKKYLILVIQGYKELVDRKGKGKGPSFGPQEEIPVSPSLFGLIDLTSPSTRFRICAKAVLATVRMKFMVRRWYGRNMVYSKRAQGEWHNIRNNNLNRAGSPTGSVRPWRSLSVVPGLKLSSLATSGHTEREEEETILSNYLRRIQFLESEVQGVFKSRRGSDRV